MKKVLIAGLALLAAASAQADTFSPGGRWNNLPGVTGGRTVNQPVDFSESYSASQQIFPAEVLTAIAPSTDATGATTRAHIKSLTFPIALYGAYLEGTVDVTAYIANTDLTDFPKEGEIRQWAPYSDGISASVTVDANDWMDAWGGSGGPGMITLTFSTPLVYEGNSLLLTFFGENTNMENWFGGDWFEGSYTFKPAGLATQTRAGRTSGSSMPVLEGALKDEQYVLPVINLEYDLVTEAAPGPEIVRGDPAEFPVNYDSADVMSEGTGTGVPVNTDYNYSGAQALYTADVLTGLNSVSADGVTKAEISKITFLMNAQGGAWDYSTHTFNVTLYADNTEATEFEKDESGKIKWAEYTTAHSGTASVTLDFSDYPAEWENVVYGGDEVVPLTITLDEPLMYEGASLLLTMKGDSDFASQVIVGTMGFASSDASTINCADDSKDFDAFYATGYPKSTYKWLPSLKLDYVPVTEKVAVKPVVFENVALGLSKATADPALSSKLGAKAFNDLSLTFSLNDPTACGEYEIRLGKTSLGTIRSTEGSIHFLPVSPNDLVLSVVPASPDAVGTTYTIAAADLEALFTAPDVQFNDYALYSEFDLVKDRRATIQGAAQFKMTATAPVTLMSGSNPSPSTARVMTTSGEYPAALEALVPANATVSDFSDLTLNGGLISYYVPSLAQVEITDETLELPSDMRISVSFKAVYPILVQEVPAIVDGSATFTAEGTYDIMSATGRSGKTVEKDYYNAENYPRNSCVARLAADESRFSADITYPGRMITEIDNIAHTIKAVAPAGTDIMFCYEDLSATDEPLAAPAADATPATPAIPELEWTAAPTNPWKFDTSVCTSGRLHVKTVDSASGANGDYESFDIDLDGNISGISDAAVSDSDAPAMFFDMQGRRVEGNLTPGLYIRRQGNSSMKINVK